jgi:hypothetical protein
MLRLAFIGLVLLWTTLPITGASVYTERIEDSKAHYLTQAEFGVHADGKSDDTGAIQAAIERAHLNSTQGRRLNLPGSSQPTRSQGARRLDLCSLGSVRSSQPMRSQRAQGDKI